ncbi:MAG: hypothetical protein M3M93_04625, partial [Actinomycetota bacterium]|nr:hypothetical protein [Actinomycetota bacterium]
SRRPGHSIQPIHGTADTPSSNPGRGRSVRARSVSLSVLAVLVLSASTAAAVALPSVCPSGFHDVVDPRIACISDGSHAAPSSGVMIPNAAMLKKEPQIALRIEIALAGLGVGVGLLVLAALGTRPHRSPASIDAVVATAVD